MEDFHIDIAPRELFRIGSFIITETMFTGILTACIIILFAAIVRLFFIPKWEKEIFSKSGFRIILEKIFTMFDSTADELTPHYSSFTGNFYFATAFFICLGTLMELFGVRPVTSDLNFTLVMGVSTFVFVFYLGFKAHKSKRFLHYINPIVTLTDFIMPLSIAIRIFASIFSGYVIMHVFYSLVPVVLPWIGTIIFTLFHALVQSYIYMFLSLSFINEAIE